MPDTYPKRRIPLKTAVLFVVLAAIGGIIGNRADAFLVGHFGPTGQVIASILGWHYAPTAIAVVAIVLMYWWSQQAPPAPKVIIPLAAEEEPPVRHTDWRGVRWRISGFSAVPYCPEHHDYRLVFRRDGTTYSEFRAQVKGDRNILYCVAGDGHTVTLGGNENPSYLDYDAARTEAVQRLAVG